MPERRAAPLGGKEALVLGAGVAGLAVATALCRFGARVDVFEQAPEITEVGAGLQISPNGVRVLKALGVDLNAAGDRSEAVELRDRSGRLVTRLDLPAEPGFLLCHRADLIAALEHAMRDSGARVQLLQRVDEIVLSDTGAMVSTAVQAHRETPLLIGADGLHSRLRPLLDGAAEPFFTGQVAWRALIPGDGGAPVAQVFMGPGRHLVSYPLRGGALRNIVAVQERSTWAAEGWNHRDDPDTLRDVFAGFGGPVPGWLAQIRDVFLWGLFRHPVAHRWADDHGRAALVGDAAHPTLPFMAQGANMALEDAWTLAAQLARQPDDVTTALRHYEALRRPRAQALIAAANANARNYHLREPMASVAHGMLRLGSRIAPSAALNRYRWIYDFDPVAAS
ncbi:MAG: FAD-dependent monooxygenase [Paracoccaceae bacterium]